MNTVTRRICSRVLIVLGLALDAQAAEVPKPESVPVRLGAADGTWPTWCGNWDRNAVSRERNLVDSFEEWDGRTDPGRKMRNVLWVAPLHPSGRQTAGAEHAKGAKDRTQVWGSPVVAGGRVYVTGSLSYAGSHQFPATGALWCFKQSDGTLLWRFRSVYIQNLYNRSWGMTATPTAEDGRVYVVNHNGDVLCLDANGLTDANQGPFQDERALLTTGRELVKVEIDAEGKSLAEITPGEPQELDASDGDVLWRYDMYREVNCRPYNCLTSGILILGDLLFLGTCSAHGASAASSSGKREAIWSPILIALEKKTGKLAAMNETEIPRPGYHGANATPSLGTVNGRELVFYADGRGLCYAFDATPRPGAGGGPGTLKMVWRCDCTKPPILKDNGQAEGFEIFASPVFHDGRVYITLGKDPGQSSKEKGRLLCIDATMEGDITEKGVIWKFDEIHASCSTVAISDGLLYAADMLGKVYCLEAASGKVVWRHELPARTAIWGSPLVADGKVYLGSRGKGLLVFAASREKRVIYDGGKLFVDVVPAVAGGVMYVAAHHALFAIGRE